MTVFKKIEAPINCPSCDSILVWTNHLLYCVDSNCPAQSQKQIEHFAKTLKIKGLGPASISKLQLTCIADIYNKCHENILTEVLGKVGEKVYKEICNSLDSSLVELLPAFGIPLIGKTAAEKLSVSYEGNLADLTESDCKAAGLGPKATESLLSWIELDLSEFNGLPLNLRFEKASTKPTTPTGIVCISGKLKSFKSKDEAEKVLKEHGFIVKGSLTKDVTILVNESGIESAKTKTARESGIKIVTNLMEILNNE